MAARRSRHGHKRARGFKGLQHDMIAAARRGETGPDRVVCLLCGNVFRTVSASHLRARHGFDGEHPVEEYKERFGLRVAACKEVCERASEVQIDFHTREGRHFTRDQVLQYIRELARDGCPLARTSVSTGLADAGIRIFGTWDDALRAAGEDPLDHRMLGGWTREAILERIRVVARDAPMTDGRAFAEHQRLYNLAMGEFGAWSRAIEAAGLDPADHVDARFWTVDKAAAWVRERHAASDSFRTRDTPGGLMSFVARETGQTWVEFVESLGIAYPTYSRREPWTDAEVLTKIRARRRRGAPLNSGAVTSDGDAALARQASERFGSWDAALKAAGVDPARVRLKRPWTREDVLDAIRGRQGRGLSLRRKDVLADDGRIVVAAEKLFPKPLPWVRALRAAGLDRETSRDSVGRKRRGTTLR
jgi:hypothetical protein